MDESAPKRRRVSSGPAAGRAPEQGAASQASGSRRSRPSFASPTKASLSRNNPEILEKRRSASPAKAPSRRASDAGSDQNLSELLTTRPEPTAHVAASEPDRDHDEAPRGEVGPGPEKPATRARAAPARRSPAKPQPRPLPPPPPEGEDELNPFIGHTLRRSPNTGVSIPPPPEPELPPVVPDAATSTPPKGIHSSPSLWREKRKSAKKSSPLKPPTEPSKKPGSVARDRPKSRARIRESPPDITLDPSTNRARRVAAVDPNAARIKERDGLREKIARLKSDLKTASEENERLRLMQSSGRIVASTNEDGVADLLRRRLFADQEPARPTLSQQLMQALLNPTGLLHLGRPLLAAAASTEDAEESKSIKSHHPVPLSAEKELPYLELFSPFTVASTVCVLPSKPDQPLRQRRLVTLRSRDVPGLFTAKLDMVVNAMSLSIVELAVTALEPSAKHELEPFAAKICSGKCNRSMQRNVGILSWAMGEWYRVATLRAQFWCRLDQRLGTSERLRESVAEAWQSRRQRQRASSAEPEETTKQTVCSKADLIRFLGQQSFEVDVPAEAGEEAGDTCSLRLQWKIDFDWTGEARSKVAVLIGLPGKWREADERGVLGRLPRLFEDLADGGQEAEEAVQTVVALLAGVPASSGFR